MWHLKNRLSVNFSFVDTLCTDQVVTCSWLPFRLIGPLSHTGALSVGKRVWTDTTPYQFHNSFPLQTYYWMFTRLSGFWPTALSPTPFCLGAMEKRTSGPPCWGLALCCDDSWFGRLWSAGGWKPSGLLKAASWGERAELECLNI